MHPQPWILWGLHRLGCGRGGHSCPTQWYPVSNQGQGVPVTPPSPTEAPGGGRNHLLPLQASCGTRIWGQWSPAPQKKCLHRAFPEASSSRPDALDSRTLEVGRGYTTHQEPAKGYLLCPQPPPPPPSTHLSHLGSPGLCRMPFPGLPRLTCCLALKGITDFRVHLWHGQGRLREAWHNTWSLQHTPNQQGAKGPGACSGLEKQRRSPTPGKPRELAWAPRRWSSA